MMNFAATRSGAIHVLDLSGGPIRRFGVHTMPVHSVHIDASGEHIASCSNEGRVVIHELYGHETQTFDYGEALTCVRLAPAYARQPELAVGSFDGHVRLKNKNWFGQMKDEDVLADRGRVEEIAWQGSGAFLAWASDAGVKVWDCRTREVMGHLPPPPGAVPSAGEGSAAQNRCCLCWADDRILLIGWGSAVHIVEIKDRDSTPGVVRTTSATAGLPDYTVTMKATIELDQAVCSGVAPFGTTELMVLCVPTKDAAPDPVAGEMAPETAAAMAESGLPEYVSKIHHFKYKHSSFLIQSFFVFNAKFRAFRYVSIARGMVRSGFEMDSPPAGALDKGESVHALEVRRNDSGINRVRFARGWTSETSKDGKPILEVVSKAQAEAGGRRPQLRIFTFTGLALLIDVMDVRAFRGATPRDYRLRHTASDDSMLDMFFVMAPHDMLVVKRRDAADHVDFLLHKGNTEEALDLAQSRLATGEIGRTRLLQIAQRWIEELFSGGKYAEAATQCERLLGDDVQAWERWIYAFAEKRRLREIAAGVAAVKLKPPKRFSSAVYEMVLQLFIDSRAPGDHRTLYELLTKWPTESYEIVTILTAVSEKIKAVGALDYQDDSDGAETAEGKDKRIGLADCLALLLAKSGSHQKSLELRLALALASKRRSSGSNSSDKRIESRAKRVFDYIDGHGLHMFIRPLVRPLVELHAERALNFFVWHTEKIPIVDVAPQLQDATHLHTYLRKAFDRGPFDGKEYHTVHMEWLVTQTTEQAAKPQGFIYRLNSEGKDEDGPLLKFLKTSVHYELDKALAACQTKQLHRCIVYILGRLNRPAEALDVIFDDLHDMKAAIAFAKAREEPRLWTMLFERALAEPAERAGEYVGQLLASAGQSVDPLMLIDRIPPGLEIPEMRNKLVNILRDYTFATRMRAGCVKVAERDSYELAVESLRARRRAVCYRPVFDDDAKRTSERSRPAPALRGGSTVRVKRARAGTLSSTDSLDRAAARRERLEKARMTRAEFAALYLPKEKGSVDYAPLATPQAEAARLLHLTGTKGRIEMSLPAATSMERLSSLVGITDDDDDYARFGMATSPKVAELIGRTVPSAGDDDPSGMSTGVCAGLSGLSGLDELGVVVGGLIAGTPTSAGVSPLRASDSTEDLQRRVASAIASAEDAIATNTPSKTTAGGEQQEEQQAVSPASPGSPVLGLLGGGLGLLAGGGADPLDVDELLSPAALSDGSPSSPAAAELSLASILGDLEGLGPMESGDELELTDVGSGETVAVESMGVDAADLQALIDGV